MKKSKFLRKAYLMTCYHIQCNENTKQDYSYGRTNKKPVTTQEIINACFCTALNLSIERGTKLYSDYMSRKIDNRTNALFFMLLEGEMYFPINFKNRTIPLFGRETKVFIY